MRRVGLIAVVLGALVFAAPVQARSRPRALSYAAAYRVALLDASDGSREVTWDDTYGVGACSRRSLRRIDCSAYVTGDAFYKYVPGGYYDGEVHPPSFVYHHNRCDWTVVSHYRGRGRTIFYYRVRMNCQDWYDESLTQ